MYFVVPRRATIVIRLRIVWSRTVVAYALFLCRAHTLSSCSGVPKHSASMQGTICVTVVGGRIPVVGSCSGVARSKLSVCTLHREISDG